MPDEHEVPEELREAGSDTNIPQADSPESLDAIIGDEIETDRDNPTADNTKPILDNNIDEKY